VLGGPGKGVSGLRQSLVCRVPEVVRDDAEFRRLQPDPLLSRPLPLPLGAAAVDFLTLVPDDLASVQGAVEHLPDGGGRPPRSIASGRRNVLGVQGALAIRVRPMPLAHISKIRRTMAACSGLIRRTT